MPVYSRPRDGRPVSGEAAVRTAPPSGGGGGGSYYPIYPYYPWGYWGGGYGFGLGYLFFDPFYCNWGYAYDCGYNYGYGYGGGMGYGGGGGGGGYSVSKERKEQGSLRLKIEPREAEIFVDGYYVGVIDSYDGAFQKLELDAGNHKIELKANGYEPLEFDVVIPVGDTVTYKGGLKRIK